MSAVQIDLTERFPHLPRAPVVEAVIEIRTRAQAPWEENALPQALKARLPEYPIVHAGRAFAEEFTVKADGEAAHTHQDLGFQSVRMQSADNRHVAQFAADGFVFSRLQPYDSWEQLRAEAMRLWAIYCDVAKPGEIQRLALRFINRIILPPGQLRLKDYFRISPLVPHGLNGVFAGFLHQDVIGIPGHPYFLNLIRTIQPAMGETPASLILDVQVQCSEPFELNNEKLERRLAEMRWLKNKAFFGSISSKTRKGFQ